MACERVIQHLLEGLSGDDDLKRDDGLQTSRVHASIDENVGIEQSTHYVCMRACVM